MAYSVPRSTKIGLYNLKAETNKKEKCENVSYENISKNSLTANSYDTPRSYNIPIEELKPIKKRCESMYDEVCFPPILDLKQYPLSSYAHPSLSSQLMRPSSVLLSTQKRNIFGSNTSLNQITKKTQSDNLQESQIRVKNPKATISKSRFSRLFSPSDQINQVNPPSSRLNAIRKLIPSEFHTPSMINFKNRFKRKK